MKRRAGSVRFDPYYKVQWWEARSLAWRDYQRSYTTRDAAEDAAPEVVPAGANWRIMLITEEGRYPL